MHMNTHIARARQQAGNTRIASCTSHETRGLVRTKRGQRSWEAEEAEAISTGQRRPGGKGHCNEGPRAAAGRVQEHPAEAGSCFSPAGPTRGLRTVGAAVGSGRAGRAPNQQGRTSENCREFRAHRVHAEGLGPGCDEAGPGKVGPKKSLLIGLVVPQGVSQGSRPGRHLQGGGRPRRRGRRERRYLYNRSGAAAPLSLQPGRGRASGAALAGRAATAAPTCPPLGPHPRPHGPRTRRARRPGRGGRTAGPRSARRAS
nr:spidroin-2-like [Camelus dromedarius]